MRGFVLPGSAWFCCWPLVPSPRPRKQPPETNHHHHPHLRSGRGLQGGGPRARLLAVRPGGHRRSGRVCVAHVSVRVVGASAVGCCLFGFVFLQWPSPTRHHRKDVDCKRTTPVRYLSLSTLFGAVLEQRAEHGVAVDANPAPHTMLLHAGHQRLHLLGPPETCETQRPERGKKEEEEEGPVKEGLAKRVLGGVTEHQEVGPDGAAGVAERGGQRLYAIAERQPRRQVVEGQ